MWVGVDLLDLTDMQLGDLINGICHCFAEDLKSLK